MTHLALRTETIEDLELSKDLPRGANLIRFGDNAATISAFVAKQVDVLVTGNTVAAKVTKENPNLKIETWPGSLPATCPSTAMFSICRSTIWTPAP